MQAVILAAGKGTRLQPHTHIIPKPLLKIKNKALLELTLRSLPEEISEVIIVVGYLGDQIVKQFGNNFKGKKIRYVKQGKLLGTAHALQICRKFLKEKFLVLMGDNIYAKKDIKKCLKLNRSILVYEKKDLFSGNEVVADSEKYFLLLNKVKNKKNCLINTGLYVLDRSFFNLELVKINSSNEFGLPQTLANASPDYKLRVAKASFFRQINNISDLKMAEL